MQVSEGRKEFHNLRKNKEGHCSQNWVSGKEMGTGEVWEVLLGGSNIRPHRQAQPQHSGAWVPKHSTCFHVCPPNTSCFQKWGFWQVIGSQGHCTQQCINPRMHSQLNVLLKEDLGHWERPKMTYSCLQLLPFLSAYADQIQKKDRPSCKVAWEMKPSFQASRCPAKTWDSFLCI